MVKRNSKPEKMLDKILNEIEELERTFEYTEDEREASDEKADKMRDCEDMLPPPLPDFAAIMFVLKDKNCDVLLLSPGGCKSCVEETGAFLCDKSCKETSCTQNEFLADFYGTRFDDISICQGSEEELCENILRTFTQKRPLFLVGSAVFHMIGFDVDHLVEKLNKAGKEAVWLESSGFGDGLAAVERVLSKLKQIYE